MLFSHIFSPLIVLLAVVGGNDGQSFGNCDYAQQVEVGNKYYIYNRNYPQNYGPGERCRWIATSDRPMTMTCDPFVLPPSDRCFQDALIIQDTSEAVGRRYCGNGTFTITSTSNQLNITLSSSFFSRGGRFLCTLETQPQTDYDPNCRCGWKNPTRIVGGNETAVNEYPMMAGLIDAELREIFCGATIINEKQVLTAAHCMQNRNLSQVGVLVGDHDLSILSETNATRLLRVASAVIHSQYNNITYDNDIAILTVIGTIDFSQQVGPVCLPFQHARDSFAGDYVELLGWGTLEFGDGPSNTLQKVRVSVITRINCRLTYPAVTDRQLCTQEPGKDSCQWDSGGPALWQSPSTRRIVEIALISYGRICGDGAPAVNTAIGPHMDWILAQTAAGTSPYCRAE